MKGHKIALYDIPKGSRVTKYAQLIGLASTDIAKGEHVHGHNLAFTNNDASTHSTGEKLETAIHCTDTFMGYQRAAGRAGTRNFIAVISSVNCSATVAHRIAANFDDVSLQPFDNVDGVAAFTHGTGCGMDAAGEGFANLQRVIAGYARHPNVGGVLIVGLGCETSQIKGTIETHKLAGGAVAAYDEHSDYWGACQNDCARRGDDQRDADRCEPNPAKRMPSG